MAHPTRITTATVCAVTAFGLLLGTARHAGAVEALFGFSSYDENETLALSLGGGGNVVLNTDGNQGWWSATFPNTIGNTNYFVGNPVANSSPQSLRDFFSFDIADLHGQTVTGATLSVTHFVGLSESGMTIQTYTLHDVDTPAAELATTDGTSAAIYNDLGTGVSYGTFNVPLVSGSGFDSFALNASGIADLNTAIAGGKISFSIGGTLPSFAAVPEPASVVLLGGGLLGLLGMRVRHRQTI